VKGKLIDLFKKKDKDSDKEDKAVKKQSTKEQPSDPSATDKPAKKGSWFNRLFKKKKGDDSAS
jgi:hypothetical protein